MPTFVERVDLLAGGFPCQPVSFAGKGLAQDDERWLWPEFARAIRALRPAVVLVENVPGLLVRGLGDVLGEMASIGYDAEWDCIPAAAFGAPHERDRVWLVAYPAGQRLQALHDEPRVFRQQARAPWFVGPSDLSDGGVARATDRRGPIWATEPALRRVDDGIPDQLDRVRALGNAVVPQVVEYIGRRILEAEGVTA